MRVYANQISMMFSDSSHDIKKWFNCRNTQSIGEVEQIEFEAREVSSLRYQQIEVPVVRCNGDIYDASREGGYP